MLTCKLDFGLTDLIGTSRVTDQLWIDYLHKITAVGELGSIPKNVASLRIGKLSKLSGGIGNAVYSSSLSYFDGSKTCEFEVVLKVYREDATATCNRESQILRALENRNFPVPQLYLQEPDKTIFGSPFVIMEKIEGVSIRSLLKKLQKREKIEIIRRFAENLAFLHAIDWTDFAPNFLRVPTDETDYAKQQVAIIRNLEDFWRVGSALDWAVSWLDSNASLYPCDNYSLLHGDMNLNNFLLTPQGRLITTDWEYPEIGDPLRDVGLAYHNMRLLFGIRNVVEGEEYAEFFVRKYAECAHKTIHAPKLNFYIFLTGVLEALSYRHNSRLALNPISIRQILDPMYIPLFPLVSLYMQSKARSVECLLGKISTLKAPHDCC